MATKWTTVTFGEVVTLAQGLCFNAKSNHLMAEKGIPLLRIADLINNTQTKFVDAERVPKKYISNPKDIIYTRTGQVGLVFKGKVGVVHNNCFRVLPQDGIEPDYVYWYLTQPSVIEKARSLAGGAAQPDLGHDAFKSISFTYPEPDVQRRIAGILSAYDELMENSQRRTRLLEDMARALYHEWFVHLRFPGHEKHPRVASPLGDIPQGWQVSCVRDLAGLISRGPSLSYDSENGVPVLNQRCVRNGEIELQAIQYAEPLSTKKSHLYLQLNDVLVNSMGVGTLGRVSRNLSITEPMIIHNCITVVRAKIGEPTAAFLYYRISDCEAHFDSLGVGATGQTSLRTEVIENVQVLLPSRELLERFANAVRPMWHQIGTLKRQIKNLRRTRDLLLPRLLSGQVALQTEVAA